MKLLIDGRLLDNRATGISRYTEQIIYAAQREFGENNVIILQSQKYNSNFKNVIYSELRPFNLIDFFKLNILLDHIKFDIFFSPFYANSYKKKQNTTYITVVHDLMYSIVPNFFFREQNHK